jgi:alcohol dehydrogenase class IV
VHSFTYEQPARRVIFDVGALARLPDEIARAGFRRVLLISTPGQRFAADAARLVGEALVGTCPIAAMHVPIDAVRIARAQAREVAADCLLAVGGGSTIGLAKAIVLEQELPIIAVPTTYAGSEMTSIYGVSEGGIKEPGGTPGSCPESSCTTPG